MASSKRRSILGALHEFNSEEKDDCNKPVFVVESFNLVEKVSEMLAESQKTLSETWTKIGLSEKDQLDRLQNLYNYHEDLQHQMVHEEEDLHHRIETIVNDLKTEYVNLCQQLKVDQELDVNGMGHMGLLQQEFHLKGRVETLLKSKDERMERLTTLLEEERELCQLLNMPLIDNGTARTGDDDVDEANVPSEEQLNEIKQHILMLQDEKERRMAKFDQTRAEIVRLVEDLELIPETSFHKAIISPDDNIPNKLSEKCMTDAKNWLLELQKHKSANDAILKALHRQLVQLWDGLEISVLDREEFWSTCLHHGQPTIEMVQREIVKYQEIRRQNMGKFIDRLRVELVALWDKCFVGAEERENFVSFKDETFTEDLLELHEREVSKWTHMYEDNKAIFEKIVKRNSLWEQKKTYDIKGTDPSRFQNRGGNLLQEEKARKRLEHEIPKLDLEIEFMIADWEKNQGNAETLLINGKKYQNYIAAERQNLKNELENIKRMRAQQKTEDGGKKLVTPMKRKAPPTSNRNTPASAVKTPRLQPKGVIPSVDSNAPPSPAIVLFPGASATAVQSSPRKLILKSSPRKYANSPKRIAQNQCVIAKPRTILCEIQEDQPSLNMPRSSITYMDFQEELKKKEDGIFNSTSTMAMLEKIDEID